MKSILCKIFAAGAAFTFGFAFCFWFMTADLLPEGSTQASAGLPEKAGEPVLVIDAGHGGFDSGASAADGTEEKNLNLAIALQLKQVASSYPVHTVMTRESDTALCSGELGAKKREDLLRRKEIMQEADADLAVSIHLNSYPQDPSVYGAQVFYPEGEQTNESSSLGSKDFAESVQAALEEEISDGRERKAMKKSDILLFQNPPCTIILVECGFLSCPEEAGKLQEAEYQRQLAEAIWQGINEKLCLPLKKKIPVTDSINTQKNN